MFDISRSRYNQGHQTFKYPNGEPPKLPARFAGLPILSPGCPQGCADCSAVCPTGAVGPGQLDLGRCLFCRRCAAVCPRQLIEFSRDYQLGASERQSLVITPENPAPRLECRPEVKKLFGRSLKIRQVSAGGCNACEADLNVLNTIGWDLARFGIQFVASPRHADALLVTGPVSRNMQAALLKTYAATPAPKLVIAAGSCAIGGGPYEGHDEVIDAVDKLLPVDCYIPGCPPHPLTSLDAILRLTGRI